MSKRQNLCYCMKLSVIEHLSITSGIKWDTEELIKIVIFTCQFIEIRQSLTEP